MYIGGNAFMVCGVVPVISPMKKWFEGVAFAKEHDAKVYVAANMVTHEGNEEGAGEFF